MYKMLDSWGLRIYYTAWSICWKFIIGRSVFVFLPPSSRKGRVLHNTYTMNPWDRKFYRKRQTTTKCRYMYQSHGSPLGYKQMCWHLAKWHGYYGICDFHGLPISSTASGSAKTGGCDRNNQTGEEICALSDVTGCVGFKTMFGMMVS